MALSDAQIDRYSRQIILPQIGGAGQERLLRSSVAVAGDGPLVGLVALSLAGAGIGRLALQGAARAQLGEELLDLNPDVRVSLTGGPVGSVAADVLVACDVGLVELDRAATLGRPLVAGGTEPQRGWMVVAADGASCAGCAARAAIGSPHPDPLPAGEGPLQEGRGGISPCVREPAFEGPLSRRERVRVRGSADGTHRGPPALASPAAGVVGSLMSLAVLKLALGLGGHPDRAWLLFDAVRSTLTEQPLARAADCPACAAG